MELWTKISNSESNFANYSYLKPLITIQLAFHFVINNEAKSVEGVEMPANISVAVEREPCREEHCEWVLFACLQRVSGNSLREAKILTTKMDTPVPSVKAELQTFRMSHKRFGGLL